MKRERKNPTKNQQSDTKERKRERQSVTKSQLLAESPPGNTVSYSLSYYSLTTSSSIGLSIPRMQRVFCQPLLRPSFIVAKHAGHTWSICINIVVPAHTCFLLSLRPCTPNKDKLFYGGNKVSHYCLYYRIQVPDRHVCDKHFKRKIMIHKKNQFSLFVYDNKPNQEANIW